MLYINCGIREPLLCLALKLLLNARSLFSFTFELNAYGHFAGFCLGLVRAGRYITFIIEGDSSAIMNTILHSLSVNYGSVY